MVGRYPAPVLSTIPRPPATGTAEADEVDVIDLYLVLRYRRLFRPAPRRRRR